MTFLQKLAFLFSRKDSVSRQMIAIGSNGRPLTTPARYDKLAEEGYLKNVIAYKCIWMISNAAANIPWVLKKKRRGPKSRREEIFEHPFFDLLEKPNPFMPSMEFEEAVHSFKLISGNSYIEAVGPAKNVIKELWPWRPDRVKIIGNDQGYPSAYEYAMTGQMRRVDVDFVGGKSAVMHLKMFNPLNDWYGMGPIQAAALAVDQHNQAGLWNLSLLQNSAMPSGYLVAESTEANPAGTISEEQRTALKAELQLRFQGGKNAGRPMLLEGGLKWVQVSMGPKDMDWLQNKSTSARDVALAFGVPPMLLGIPGDNTYSNYKEANQAFYEQTVIPHKNALGAHWTLWLLPALGSPDIVAEIDKDQVEALAGRREVIWEQTGKASFLTENEKRDRLGYEATEGGDVILVPATMVPLSYVLDGTNGSETPPPNDGDGQDPEDPTDEATDPQAGKSLNLSGKRAKLRHWKESGRLRAKHERRLARKISALFNAQGEELKTLLAGASNAATFVDQAELHLNKSKPKWKTILRASLLEVGSEFGKRTLSDLKTGAVPEEEKADSSRFTIHFQEWVDRNVGKKIDDITEETRRKLRKRVEQWQESGEPLPKLSEKIDELYDGFGDGRSDTIARTEVHGASNAASLEAAKSTGIPNLKKEWIFTQDSKTRDQHKLPADEQIVGVDEKFYVGGESLDAPGDPAGSPGNVINCRCTVAFVSEGEE